METNDDDRDAAGPPLDVMFAAFYHATLAGLALTPGAVDAFREREAKVFNRYGLTAPSWPPVDRYGSSCGSRSDASAPQVPPLD